MHNLKKVTKYQLIIKVSFDMICVLSDSYVFSDH